MGIGQRLVLSVGCYKVLIAVGLNRRQGIMILTNLNHLNKSAAKPATINQQPATSYSTSTCFLITAPSEASGRNFLSLSK